MARTGRHAQWPVGAWIDSRSGETHAGIEDHADFAAKHPDIFGVTDDDLALLRQFKAKHAPKPEGKAEFLRRIIRRGWIRARGQYFDVPSFGENVLMDVVLYGKEVGVWDEERVYIQEVDSGRSMDLPLGELQEQAVLVQPVEGPETRIPRELRVYVGLRSKKLGKTFGREALIRRARRYFEGATALHATGLWKGETEPSIVLTVLNPEEESYDILRHSAVELSADIIREMGQDAVLVEWVFDDEFRFESFARDQFKNGIIENPYWFD